ncbi:MAG: crossover junction endodeoxyribonuclease RuvC [Candidatus Magasanikbacteria bacterium]|nr:crossover junction endodeoxyribonuclease RuvC [Candidatus Magasanikbacteria bacterium]
MRILGIDPGFGRLGYGIVEVEGRGEKAITFGCIETEKNLPRQERLQQIFVAVNDLMDTWAPTHLAIEELFFNQNVNTALGVGEARGVVLLAAAERGLAVSEHQPLSVKLTITGDGRADKRQIQKMIQMLLKLDQPPKPDDAADALAIALTAARHLWQTSRL